MSEAPIVKEEYEAAVRKYNKSNSTSSFKQMFFMFLPPLLGLIFIFDLLESNTTQTGAEHRLWIGIWAGLCLLFLFVLPITWGILYQDRLIRNLRLNCPLCNEFIGSEKKSVHILKTGMCSECKGMLFAGELTSKAEVLQYNHQLKIDDNQRSKSAIKFSARIAILALIPSLLIYAWTKSINESMGKETPSVFLFLAPFLFYWILFKLALKFCVRDGEKLKETAREMNFHSLKGNSNN